MEEEELVRRLRRGDTRALEILIQQYTAYVSAVAARILPGQPEDWEEITADTFLAAWNSRDKLWPGRLGSYLGAIARNRAFNIRRAQKEALPLEDDVLTLEPDAPHQAAEARELSQLLYEALNQLDERPRELFLRHYYYGQTVAVAAAAMEVNLSTAKTWLRRGRETLKICLEKEGYFDEREHL